MEDTLLCCGVLRRAFAVLCLVVAPWSASAQPPAETETPPEEANAEVEAGSDAEGAEGAAEGEAGGETGETGEAGEAGEVEGAGNIVPPPPGTLPAVIVIDAAPYGIDPVVGQHVTRRMRQTASDMGYEVVAADATIAAAQRLQMPYPPSPADLWRVTFVAEARRGAFARVWAHQGSYVIEISVASLDGTGPFFARGTAGSTDLHQVVERLTREALPTPDTWDADAAERLREQSAQPQQAQVPQVTPTPIAPVRVARRPRRDRRPTRRFDVALQVEGAIGTSSDNFFNFLGGVRLGLRITNTLALGLYVGYVNLRGRDGRVNNILPMLQLENRIRLSARSDITVPLRFGLGYLPYNGPVVRLAAGLNVPLSSRVELAFDILAPTFWVLPDRTAVSFNLAAEVIFRLGSAASRD